MKRLLLLAIGIITILLIVAGVYTINIKNEEKHDTGEDFVFIDSDNNERHLRDYRGRIVILDLWATWCGPCQYQMIELHKLYNNYSRDQLEIISINMDPNEDINVIKEFIGLYSRYGYNLEWVFGDDNTGDIWRRYKGSSGAIPVLCIFNQDGRLVYQHEGLAVYSEIPEGFPSGLTRLKPIIDELIR